MQHNEGEWGGVDVDGALLHVEMPGSPELRSAQELLGPLLDSLQSAVFWKNLDSRYLGCNPTFAALAGRTVEEMIGLGDADMPWTSDEDHYVSWDRRVMEENRTITDIRESIRTHDGRTLWISTTKAPLHDGEGNVIGLVGTFRDITVEVEAETKARSTVDELDRRVTERTKQLMRANENLRREIDERVRLQAGERQLREYAEIRRDIGAAMAQTLDLEKILDILLLGTRKLVSGDLVAILLVEDTGLRMERVESTFDYRITTGGPTADRIAHHPSLRDPGVALEHDGSDARWLLGPARSSMAVGMVTGGVLIGYLLLESRWSGFYSNDQLERLRGVAEQAAAVISNIRMTERAAELAAADERNRLRRDLHDSVVQTLAAAAMVVDTELVHMQPDDPVRPAFERIQQLSAYANTEIRALLSELTPETRQRCLFELLADLPDRPDWPFTLRVHGDRAIVSSLDEVTTTALFRITSEALHNARRHAGATAVDIRLAAEGPALVLTISDNGVGFDPGAVEGDHLGLQIMAERAREVNARFSIDSSPACGTTVRVVVAGASDQRASDQRASDQRDVVDRHEDAFGSEGADAHDRSLDVDGGGAVG